MKITAIDTFTLRIPTQKPIALDLPEHRLVVTRIQTDADTDGLGYALVFGGAGSESVEAYARRLATLLIGEDPTQVGRLWDKMYRADRGIRKVGVAGYALSALDIGLWDVAGKAAGLPLAKMWGAVTDRVAADRHVIACMLGGVDRRTLFVLAARAIPRAEARAQRDARILATTVEVPGAGSP